jgi:sigma-B regulation protein RsbU (phosphoserine phosphatase)
MMQGGKKLDPEALRAMLAELRRGSQGWNDRDVYVWKDGKPILNSTASAATEAPILPAYVKQSFHEVAREQNRLHLRALESISTSEGSLTVLSSVPLDQPRLQDLAASLGQITLYASGLTLRQVRVTPAPASGVKLNRGNQPQPLATMRRSGQDYVLDTGQGLKPTFVVGNVPQPAGWLDRQVTFPTSLYVVDWETGDTTNLAAIGVETRVSKLYESLFGSLGEFAPAIEFLLLLVAIFFGLIELVALFIGTRLTRSITQSVAQLYEATRRINRGDFSQRIPVKSKDQLATLANSFNSMTASLQELIAEQKEKQRMENELVIAQEVQAQLFPQHIRQLASLEMFGFCRPARTVSGDYYDFVTVTDDKLILAVGDISGKGISSALLMATIHSAVRAYSVEAIPALREAVAAGSGSRGAGWQGTHISPGQLLALLNHQLWESTPAEKYATLFLGVYDSSVRRLTYSNGGHLPPMVLSEDGSVRRLEHGGTVVGLFDEQNYQEGSILMSKGDIFIGFSDGVTEPENDFGEFGEDRLIELVRENSKLPLARITEVVTAAVDDWIGANEQPDDITLVLARAR